MTSRRRERGVVLAITALGLVTLLLFVAFAVDYGAAVNQRRKSQNTADAGALAGGRLMLTRDDGAAVSNDDIAQEIITITWQNVRQDTAFTEANDLTRGEWAAMFATCTDPDAGEYPIASSVSACIRFNTFGSRVRVRLPTLHTFTAFARVIGVESIAVNGVAEAELVPNNSGALMPFGLPSSSAGDTEVCLKAPSTGHAPAAGVCNDSLPGFDNEGNFGSLDIATYGNPVLGTPEHCTGNTNGRLELNMALGVDHPMDEYREPGEETEAIRNDRLLCNDVNARPNQMLGQKGIGSNLDAGMLAGITVDGRSIPGRLTRTPWSTVEVRNGVHIDNRPLWEYIDPTLADPTIPLECVRSIIEAQPSVALRNVAMTACIDAYKAGGYTVEMFTADSDSDGMADLLATPRVAFVPQLWAWTWATADGLPQLYNIRAFRPVFLQTLYFKCTSTACAGAHSPGQSGGVYPLPSNNRVDAMTAYLLPEDAVPQPLLDNGPSVKRERQLVLRR